MKTWMGRLALLVVFALVVGCGGGGGGGDTQSTNPTFVVEGRVLNGVIVGSTVEISGGKDGSALGTATTDTNGRFSARVSHQGPYRLRAHGGRLNGADYTGILEAPCSGTSVCVVSPHSTVLSRLVDVHGFNPGDAAGHLANSLGFAADPFAGDITVEIFNLDAARQAIAGGDGLAAWVASMVAWSTGDDAEPPAGVGGSGPADPWAPPVDPDPAPPPQPAPDPDPEPIPDPEPDPVVPVTHTVSAATTGAGGNVSPASQMVHDGTTAVFTVTPETGYSIDQVSGCDGSLDGSTYTTGAIAGACTVEATFALLRYTLTYAAGPNGTLEGEPVQTVSHGTSGTAVTAAPDTGYSFVEWSDASTANPRADSNVTGDLSVTASFALNSYTVSATAGAGGSIDPTSQTVSHGGTVTFTVTPDTGYQIDAVSGCNGSLDGSTYNTGLITGACTVEASFALNSYNLDLSWSLLGGEFAPTIGGATVLHDLHDYLVLGADVNLSDIGWAEGDPSVPDWLALYPASGLLSGTPSDSDAGLKAFQVVATRMDGESRTAIYTINIGGEYIEVLQISAGWGHACAVTTSGGAKCWGNGSSGQLGNDSTVSSTIPVDVLGLTSGVASIHAGNAHTCVVTNSGGVKCWGSNLVGQLGNGATSNSSTPVQVSGLTSGITAISAGVFHTCALTTEGGVKCWGRNNFGQLGIGFTSDSSNLPVDVSLPSSGVASIGAGSHHTCAVRSTGGAVCWGMGGSGQLGNNGTTDSSTPVDVVGLESGVAMISGGLWHTCAVTTSGGAMCWGQGTMGQLGTGLTGSAGTSSKTPVTVNPNLLGSGVASITAGHYHTCAVTTDGGAKCWGQGNDGQLGNGHTNNRGFPTDVSGLTSGVVSISANSNYTCAVTTSGRAKCWGLNAGQFGNGSLTNSSTPVDVGGVYLDAVQVSAGVRYTCAVTSNGSAWCWGQNNSGQLGDGTTAERHTPVNVSGLDSGVVSISAGDRLTCALTTEGGVKCWGGFTDGAGQPPHPPPPSDVGGLESGAVSISVGGRHACALTTEGGVKCWGANGHGQLGNGATSSSNDPVQVSGLTSGVTAISAGSRHTCAVHEGAAKCWGSGRYGQLGNGSTSNSSTPVQVSGLTSGVTAISAGMRHACALTTEGGVKCWGANGHGQFGNGSTVNSSTPVQVSGLTSGVTAISAGSWHTCAMHEGPAKCWGRNSNGELGVGHTSAASLPVRAHQGVMHP